MLHRRSKSKSKVTRLATSAGLLLAHGTASAASGFDGNNNVAIYWGQNSFQKSSGDLEQQSLATYCANTNIDIIPMAFMVQITTGEGGEPVINFANSGNDCKVFSDTATLDCPNIGDDIKTCQQKYGKTILLSIGGATYTEGGFESKDAAVAAANLVWNTFGPASGSSSNSSSSSSMLPSATNTSSMIGSVHSTSTGAVNSTGTTKAGRQATATMSSKNATLTLPSLLSTGLGLNTTSLDKGNTADNSATLTKSSTATTSDAEMLSLVTTVVTMLMTVESSTAAEESAAAVGASASSSNVAAHAYRKTVKIGTTPQARSSTKKARSSAFLSTHTLQKTFKTASTKARSSPYLSTRTMQTVKIAATGVILSTTSSSWADTHKTLQAAAASSKTETAKSSPSSTLTTKHAKPTAETLDYTTTHGKRDATTVRPFGDAVLDGFDLDLETAVTNFNAFASQLRTLMDGDTSKKYYLTAAPQCPYPDAADDSMLNGAPGMPKVKFDAIFVQFYNNFCGLQSFTPNATNQTNFNFDTWDTWATTDSANPDVKVFLGVPAGQTAAGTGYTDAAGLKPIIEYCKTFTSFGGVMAWDASQAYANSGFLEGVKGALGASSKRARGIRRRLVEREWWG